MHDEDLHLPTAHGAEAFDALAREFAGNRVRITLRHDARAAMRCVASGHLADHCPCEWVIPEVVVTAAWARERGTRLGGDRFFRFSWCGAEWLGYGLEEGGVRGVYCPEHRVERDERSVTLRGRTELLEARSC